MALRLQSLREEDRKSMARELHDEMGSYLTVAKIDLDESLRKVGPGQTGLRGALGAVQDSLNRCIACLQRITSELRPPLLDDFGLIAAIEHMTREFQDKTGIQCRISVNGTSRSLENLHPDRKLALFRIVQEGLTNIARHTKASFAEISLLEKKKTLFLMIQDDGKGISRGQVAAPTSYGLIGIRERVLPWRGKVDIKGIPGKGTRITVRLPSGRA